MKRLFTLTAIVLLLASCQKEISDESGNQPGGGGNNTGNLLYRMGIRSGADSITIDYNYNSAGRISNYKLLGTSGGSSIDETIDYTRNSSNIITQEVYKSSSLSSYGLSQILTNHVYDDASSTYKYSITKITSSLGSVADSIVYEYDGNKRLVRQIEYVNIGSGYVEDAKEEYTYIGNNVASYKFYGYNSQTGAFELDGTESYEYDDKTNPLLFTVDAVVLKQISNLATFFSSNNYVRRTVVQPDGSSGSATRTFTYNSNNRPTSSVSGSGATTSYYYK